MEGGTTDHFVADGIESALERAREAAGGKDVMLWGGGTSLSSTWQRDCWTSSSSTLFQYCSATVLASFDNLLNAEVQLEQVRAVEAPGVTHLKYRVVT